MKVLFLTFCFLFCVSGAAKILAIFPMPSHSHFIIGDVLTKKLASRGHEVTIVSGLKPKTASSNPKFTELPGLKESMEEQSKEINFFDYQNTNGFLTTFIWYEFGYEITKNFYENEGVQKLIKSKETYDVIIIEHFFNHAAYGLCDLFKAPCIAFFAVSPTNWANKLTGNIGMASYVPQLTTSYSPKMTFFERLHNLALILYEEVLFHAYTLPKMDKLLHDHIPSAPPLQDLIYNISMIFLNSHPALTAPVPLTPNMIELAGIHVEGLKNATLPSDLQLFLDKSSEGVIYFALGSNVKSKDMPKGTLQEIIKALKKWGKPILWKYEEELPEKIDNVKIAKWFPQTAVLAHKNVIAFITHCGRLSALESLYYGVPMIGLPVFAEQARNAAEMAHYGYAIALNFNTLNAKNLYDALVEITTNPTYSEQAKIRSKAMRKRNALDEAVYWIEHVVEFKGATYLKNAGVDLPWYQLWMVDVVGVLVVSFLGFNAVVVYFILRLFTRKPKAKGVVSKQKKKN